MVRLLAALGFGVVPAVRIIAARVVGREKLATNVLHMLSISGGFVGPLVCPEINLEWADSAWCSIRRPQ